MAVQDPINAHLMTRASLRSWFRTDCRRTGTLRRSCPRTAVRKPITPLFLSGIIRSLNLVWLVEKEDRERSPAEKPPLQKAIVRNQELSVNNW